MFKINFKCDTFCAIKICKLFVFILMHLNTNLKPATQRGKQGDS